MISTSGLIYIDLRLNFECLSCILECLQAANTIYSLSSLHSFVWVFREFVNCVRCIKILSPQEVQQMSLDGDFGNSVLPNQAGSSSDNVNA